MKIELSDSLKPWVEQQAEMHGQPTADAFVESVLQQAKTRLQMQIEHAILESLRSGDPIEATPEYWEVRSRELERRLNAPEKAAG